jgi:hypothetical protein
VRIDITGPVARTFHIATNAGKAAHVEADTDAATSPLCTITLDSNTYIAMCCGRQFFASSDPRVNIAGDVALGERVMAGFNVMI